MAASTALRGAPQRDDNEKRSSLPAKGLIPLKATIQIRPSNLAAATTISPAPQSPQAPVPQCNGPTSGITTILPRPKPGRKPASDEPENKRKAQNRAAQRAFRERKLLSQQQLELENKELKTENERLEKEIQLHKNNIAHFQATQARLDAELTESRRREHDLRSQLEINLSTLAACERRMREAEAKTNQYLNELHSLRAEAAILRSKVNKPVRHSGRPDASIPPSVTNPTGGCDDCGKDGSCPCVDSYLQNDEAASKENTSSQRNPMSVESMLSPTVTSEPSRMNSIPELISDHSSPEDMEIDFTYAFKTSQLSTIPKSDKCGFCEDGGKCICAEAEANIEVALPHPDPPATVAIANTSVPKSSKPGTCAQCQANPEQKAYCESLARARLSSRGTPEGEPVTKRSRTSTRNVPVPCAEAYQLYKRYSSSKEAPSYDEVYQDYMKMHSTEVRGDTAQSSSTSQLMGVQRPKEFSAYEADIAAVIATLHKQPPRPKNLRGTKS
ncbi:uncharacterized protein PV09_02073 [Verruconis gallopava]|uniref:BZIP domain-containing protein n=1 Tax=Verruconis gallopava TaxID=253628 RepID=A0A0D2AK26_9PEZI|nr:uncharacterized protein PV09_02073 [Verruconis gallopava]KIW07208.1 hypothetical protein PV09_02073 [Verruconis gallopava]